ncbi:MAG: coproporphyrinogen dehydrogenase, partial [Myxococcales bacterium]|nr:coproporphyrinogen dehydrogenase [Myxococcales bacterium]
HTQAGHNAEWSIEVDPRSVDADYMALLRDLGFNRFSFGVQDLQANVMAAVGRKQGVDEVRAAVDAVGDCPFNLDLMYGLPYQTVDSLLQTLDQAIDLGPSRFALFGYAHVPWLKKHQLGMERHGLPDDQARLSMALAARQHLVNAGYVAIGIDHFALPSDELAQAKERGELHRNFMGYTVRPHLDLVALGVSGISQVAGTFTQNHKDVQAWRTAIDSGEPAWSKTLHTTADDQLRSAVIMDLMCHFAIDKQAIGHRFDIDFDQHFADEQSALTPFISEGLVTDNAARLQLSPLGELVVRNVAMIYDARLGQTAARYSRTV